MFYENIDDFKELLFILLFFLTILYQDRLHSKRIYMIDKKFQMVIKRLKMVNPEDLLRIENPSMGKDKLRARIKNNFKERIDKLKIFKKKKEVA